jgi:hypothetical protein
MASIWRKIARFVAKAIGLERATWIRQTWIERLLKARVIEFYVPKKFRKSLKQIAARKRGRVIAFPSLVKKSA